MGPFNFNIDLPAGSARRPAERLVRAVEDLEDAQLVGSELQRRGWMLEWHMPDRDVHYPSALVLSRDTGRLRELTIRMGPLGDQSEVDRDDWATLEADWTDVALDAGQGTDMMEYLNGYTIDLGDRWVAEEVRPHIRMKESEDGYDVAVADLVQFIEELDERFRSRFDVYEERRYDPEYRDYFRGA